MSSFHCILCVHPCASGYCRRPSFWPSPSTKHVQKSPWSKFRCTWICFSQFLSTVTTSYFDRNFLRYDHSQLFLNFANPNIPPGKQAWNLFSLYLLIYFPRVSPEPEVEEEQQALLVIETASLLSMDSALIHHIWCSSIVVILPQEIDELKLSCGRLTTIEKQQFYWWLKLLTMDPAFRFRLLLVDGCLVFVIVFFCWLVK